MSYEDMINEFKKDSENCVERITTLVEIITKFIEDGKNTISKVIDESKALAKSVVKVFKDVANWFKSLFHVSKKVDELDTGKLAEINDIIGA